MGQPLLESVGEHEPWVETLRDTLRAAIRQAMIPMKAYAQEYERFLPLSTLDVHAYIRYYNYCMLFININIKMLGGLP